MTTWVLSVSLLLGGALQDGSNSSAKGESETSSKQVTARRYHEINRDLRALLREQATAKTPGQQTLVIRKLVRLYGEICQHPDLATSDTLKSYRVKLRGRLLRIQQELERQITSESSSYELGTEKRTFGKKPTHPTQLLYKSR